MGAESTAELTLILKAKNTADAATSPVTLALEGISRQAGQVRDDLGRVGPSLSAGVGNLTENLLTGQDFGQAATNLGAFLAGETVQEFGAQLVAKMAGSTVVEAVSGVMATFGSTIGGLIAAAIPVGMALWPALLVGAIVAGVVFLINNPELVATIADLAGRFVHGLLDGVAALPGLMLGVFGNIASGLITASIAIAGTFVNFWLGLPLRVARAIFDGVVAAGHWFLEAVGRFVAWLQSQLPNLGPDAAHAGMSYAEAHGLVPHHAEGGWVGLRGPEIGWLGEDGPEYVRKAGTGTGEVTSGMTRLVDDAGRTIGYVDPATYNDLVTSTGMFRLAAARA